MSEYKDLTNPQNDEIYLRVPARSRQQSFALFEITDNRQLELDAFKQEFEFQYLWFDSPNKTLIYIPFSQSIKSKQFDELDFDFKTDNFRLYIYGESIRSRVKNNYFKIENATKEKVNPLNYSIDDNPHFDINKIKQGLTNHINTKEFKTMLKDKLETRKFLHSLANDSYNQIYTQNDIDVILDELSNHIKDVKKEYATAYNDINKNSALRSKTKPFGEYLKLYKTTDKSIKNIAQQMLSVMNPDFEPNPKLALPIACDLIAQTYPPALIKQNGKDRDNVVIFNPITGVWTHDEDIFYSLLTAIKPYSNDSDLKTMIATFGAKARNKNNFIKPYSASRHLLFTNCALDIKYMKMHELNENEVKDLHFTDRCKINLKYNPNVIESPVIPNQRSFDNGDWDPYSFFSAYADNDRQKLNFLMFGLSLGLFGGHNFGVHFSMRGESRWGKSTLNEIFKALYPNRVVDMLYSKLNEQFGLTNYKPDTSIVWFRECNVEAPPLNNDYGVPVYDSFADNNMMIQIKRGLDLNVENPPQVFVDGTSYVKADDMDTGPAGRTFVFKFPMEGSSTYPVQQLTQQAYAKSIVAMLHDETVLQFLVNLMIASYTSCLKLDDENKDRLWNLKLNLGGKSPDNKLLPDFAREWRKEMTQTQGDIQDWFEYEFSPYFSLDPEHPTEMHDALAYGFYVHSYQTKFARQDPKNRSLLTQNSFSSQFTKLLKQHNWEKINLVDNQGKPVRKSRKYLYKTNFDVDSYKNDDYQIPREFTDENLDAENQISPYPLGKRTTGWYTLQKVEN